MSSTPLTASRNEAFRTWALWALLAAFAWRGLDIFTILGQQPPGADFLCFWAGALTSVAEPGRIYDFAHISALQHWPLGPGNIRPFIYPPSSIPLFLPFATQPYEIGYALWVATTGGLFAWAARRAGAPWWMLLFPVVWLVGLCGQVTYLIGGLATLALTFRNRPTVAGILLGVAAAVKPQLLLFAPVALAADRNWRAMWAAGLTGATLCLASAAVWGLEAWTGWIAALPRFASEVIFNTPGYVEDALTPYALLVRLGSPGAWAYLLAPLAVWMVWRTFRATQDLSDRLIALFGAALLVSPYAMNYEAALFAPAVANYLARTRHRLWPVYATLACAYTVGLVYALTPVLAVLGLPLVTWIERRSLEGGRLKPAAA